MDAGTAAAVSNGRPRAVNDEALFRQRPNSSSGNQFYQLQHGSNYDLAGPSYSMTNSNSRKASMTSQSTQALNHLFRRNKAGTGIDPVAGQFDEEAGADIQDIAGNSVSFDDIRHIRDRGPYGMTGGKTLDTTPIIPTLGTGGNGSQKNMSNVQYRKQMNHNMKQQLTTGARAMSLAGGNPMQQQQQQQPDPRAMSFNSFSNVPRSMSLNPNMAMQQGGDPRTMSLNNRPQNMPMANGPRSMSMRSGGMPTSPTMYGGTMPPPNGYMNQGPGGPGGPGGRTMSLNNQYQPMPNGMMPNNMAPNGVPNGMAPNGMHNGMAPNGMMHNGMMHNGMMPNGMMPNGMMPNMPPNGMMPNGMPPNNMPPNMPPQMSQGMPTYSNRGSVNEHQGSSDSLMNVVEEEDEEPQSLKGKIPESDPQDDDESNAIYNFEEEDDNDTVSLSRKSTLKKSNSMRLRKLNLFSTDEKNIEEEDGNTTPVKSSSTSNTLNNDKSPSFNVARNSQDESIVKSSSEHSQLNDTDKREQLGMNGNASNDVYYTASDFHSPSKQRYQNNNDIPEDDYNDSDYDETITSGKASNRPIVKDHSHKSLTENTVFHNFRQSSSVNRLTDQKDENDNNDDNNNNNNNNNPPLPSQSNESSDKSDLNMSKEIFGNSTPPTANSSNFSSSTTNFNNEFKNERSTNTNDLMNSPFTEDDFEKTSSKREKKTSRNFSLSNKSKGLLKRLSKSSRRSSTYDDNESIYDSTPTASKRNSLNSTPGNQRRSSNIKSASQTPIKFSKEELGIMTLNNDLLNELELVTTELASSIRRELALENSLKNSSHHSNGPVEDLEEQIRQKLKIISELEEKLTKERRLRYISEEHALLMEGGQSPSPMKLNYEKTELHRQLLVKNDLCNQLQDKLADLETNEVPPRTPNNEDQSILDKYNELLKENAELKFTKIPELEKRAKSPIGDNRVKSPSGNKQLTLISDDDDDNDEYDEEIGRSQEQLEIQAMKQQTDDMREVITKLNNSHNYEMKLAQDKLKSLENKLQEQTGITERLRERFGGNNSNASSSSNLLNTNKGGKLQGFSIVFH